MENIWMIVVVISDVVMFCTPARIIAGSEKTDRIASMISPIGETITIGIQLVIFILMICLFMLVLLNFCSMEEQEED